MGSLNETFFVDRELLLQKLHDTWTSHHLILVAGRSGSGKTAMLREYARRFSQQYQAIVWFNAATDETLLADLIAALQTYSLPTDKAQEVEHLFHILYEYLSKQHNSLLIIDNFAYNFTVRRLHERQAGVRTIVSTHVPHLPPEIPRLELTALDAQNGALLLLRQARLLSPEQGLHDINAELQRAAQALSREVRGLPITIDLIGRYLHVTGCSGHDYLDMFRSYPAPQHQSGSMDPNAMEEFAIVCECSLHYLRETNPAVVELLQMIALHLPEAIPSALFQFQDTLVEHDSVSEPSNIGILLASGLVSIDASTASLTMHRLIQDIVLQTLSEDEKRQRSKQLFYLWQKLLPRLTNESPSLHLCMASQIRHLASISESESSFFDEVRNVSEAAEVFAWAGGVYREQQLIGVAEPLLRRALAVWQHTHGDAHPLVATILVDLAIMNRALKNYGEAEAFAHRAVVSKSSALGINHPDVLLTLDLLGHIYTDQDKLPEARQCYEKALTIGEKVELTRNPIYNTLRYDLALLHIEQKNWGRAEELLRRVSIGRMVTLGAEDPDTIEAFSRLAEVCRRSKNWTMAEVAYKRILPVQKKLLGAEHPTVLHYLEQQAGVFLHLNRIDEAKQQLQHVQEVKERELGKEHRNLIPCLNGLAQVALAEQEYDTGLALLARAQQIYAQLPDPEPLIQAALLDTTASIELAREHFDLATSLSLSRHWRYISRSWAKNSLN
ncbi:tetratricopeptide repeat protein [Dictyobacter aurantiacus]|uniref:AAA+ ATPase domain-containing protein n=1 Tax=Dictyobacter aurantiacus TaxID=1936993 RepID=A0A401Z8F5_9CHLR|nr:tetratricopeptide repeat protein [Dictyobacter aurantiacus]GCE03098.1 hypothetical protein KDAU_04270 [Dictyobacter aurantiacus]